MLNQLSAFALEGSPISCERYGNGHINETYRVETDNEALYILQKINQKVFTNPEAVMRNLQAVTSHLKEKVSFLREVLTLIPTKSGEGWLVGDDGEYWRVFPFVSDSLSLDLPESAEDFRQSGIAFGRFQRQLADFAADTLTETIPRFHDTPNRFAALHAAIDADVKGRAAEAAPEIEGYLAREDFASTLVRAQAAGALPLRVTHNDTKLNNVLFDAATRKALCVIDLDTVMPGLSVNDFGDSIRFGASTATEDETDLAKVSLSLPMFEAYTDGFLSACGGSLTSGELEHLVTGAKMMTLECGARFLTDFLAGDVYFHTAREKHNLDRCRTQLALVVDMEAKWEEMQRIVGERAAQYRK
ncbi:MAG: phosphotransferase enzyme family protein [Oscillospiraceae bacterium]